MTEEQAAEAVESTLAGLEQCFYCDKWFHREDMLVIGHRPPATGRRCCVPPSPWVSCVDIGNVEGRNWKLVYKRKVGKWP